jgi:hypothetical protein
VRICHTLFPLPDPVVVDNASMIDLMVRQHLQHSDPAPQAADTCLMVLAPATMAAMTVSLVTP